MRHTLQTILVYGSWALAVFLVIVGSVVVDRGHRWRGGLLVMLALAAVLFGFCSSGAGGLGLG